jgi:heme exporter protein A
MEFEFENVSVSMNEKVVLNSINLRWKKGETIALFGANGAGKSTLLKVISTLIKPLSGEVQLPDNFTLKQWKESLGIVFPEPFLYDSLTAYENLQFYQKLYGDLDRRKIHQLLEQVQLLSVQHDLVGSFSKGMKQRLSIARSLIHDPIYLLLDEPFDGLDAVSKTILEELLMEKQNEGVGYILVSHDISQTWKLCERALLLKKGRIVLEEECSKERYQSFIDHYQSLMMKENQHDVF